MKEKINFDMESAIQAPLQVWHIDAGWRDVHISPRLFVLEMRHLHEKMAH